MKNIYIIVCVFFLIISCNTKTNDEVSNILCDNQQYLLAPNKDLPTFNFDLNINPKEHIQVLKDSLKVDDLCDKFTQFNCLINDRIVELSIIPYCVFLGQHFTRELELNHHNQLLLFHELSSLQNIKEKIIRDYPFEKNKLNIIDIRWEYGLSKSITDKVIHQISEGYLEAIERISKEKLKKSICELDLDEVKTIKLSYPLTLDLKTFSDQITKNHIQKNY